MTSATLVNRNFDYGLRNPLQGFAMGVSDAAKSIKAKLSNITESNLTTITGINEAGFSSKAFTSLIYLMIDGEKIPYEIFSESIDFLKQLPLDIPIPDIGNEPNGAVTFEWYVNPYKVFVISINGTNTLEFAALIGKGNEWHGKVNYSGEMPLQIKTALEMFLTA